MKKLLFVMLFLLVVAGCEKEETPEDTNDTTTTTNSSCIKYDGETYAINKILFTHTLAYMGGTDFVIKFVPSTVSYNASMGRLEGVGVGMQFFLTVPDTLETLPIGSFEERTGSFAYNQFYGCQLLLSDYDWSTHSGTSTFILDGTLTISKAGDVYTVNFEGTDLTSKTINLYYKGSAQSCS